MLDDLEEFLRRAAEQRSQQAPRPSQPAQPVIEILDDAVEAEIVEARPLSSVAAHVERHHFGEGVADHASHLAEDISLADERMESHLHEAFDHRVGSMDNASTFIGEEGDNASDLDELPPSQSRAEELASMLRSPTSIRNAVILSEILRRPNW